MTARWQQTVHQFHDEDRGSVAIMFGVLSFVLFFAAGMAIDYSRALDLKTRMTAAIDAAALAVGREMVNGTLNDEQLTQFGETYFNENSKAAGSTLSTIGKPNVTFNRDTGVVDISAVGIMKTTLTRLGGYETLTVPVASTAVFNQKDIEVGMALDLTGSMNSSIKGKRKIDSLKAAFEEFADEIFPDQPNPAHKIRVALAPYSAGVKLGAYANGSTTATTSDGCVSERKGGGASDATGKFYVKADSPKDLDPLDGQGPFFGCPPPVVTPLSDNKLDLVTKVNGYSADGYTSGHLGAQWAWNLVSDKWSTVWGSDSAPEDYAEIKKNKLMKAVVLMTDGAFNTSFHGDTSAKQAIELCQQMRSKDVIVFSVGFGLGSDAKSLATLKACATPGDDYFAAAEDEEDLKRAFRQFAATLTKLRLSQ